MNLLDKNSEVVKELLTALDTIGDCAELALIKNKPRLNGEMYLGNKEVCHLLNISPRSLQEYRDKGRIAFYKLEGKILFAESDILKMLEDNYYKSWEQD